MIILLILLSASDLASGRTKDKIAPENCAECHSNSIAFKEWQDSGHVKSLESLLEQADTDWTCLKCHSADYERVREIVRNTEWRSVADMPTVNWASNPVPVLVLLSPPTRED